jgi:hypothetical protein
LAGWRTGGPGLWWLVADLTCYAMLMSHVALSRHRAQSAYNQPRLRRCKKVPRLCHVQSTVNNLSLLRDLSGPGKSYLRSLDSAFQPWVFSTLIARASLSLGCPAFGSYYLSFRSALGPVVPFPPLVLGIRLSFRTSCPALRIHARD